MDETCPLCTGGGGGGGGALRRFTIRRREHQRACEARRLRRQLRALLRAERRATRRRRRARAVGEQQECLDCAVQRAPRRRAAVDRRRPSGERRSGAAVQEGFERVRCEK